LTDWAKSKAAEIDAGNATLRRNYPGASPRPKGRTGPRTAPRRLDIDEADRVRAARGRVRHRPPEMRRDSGCDSGGAAKLARQARARGELQVLDCPQPFRDLALAGRQKIQ